MNWKLYSPAWRRGLWGGSGGASSRYEPYSGQDPGCNPATAQGRTIQEVIRLSELQRFVVEALSREEPVEQSLILYGGGGKDCPGAWNAPPQRGRKRIGVLMVLNDVTRLAKLENIRKDFVAHVSHEIKTPITAIRGVCGNSARGPEPRPRGCAEIPRNHSQARGSA